MKYYFIALVFLLTSSCQSQSQSQSQGYENLDTLYSDFVSSLKLNDTELKKYCFKITPDAGTIKYMEKNNFSYRGIPEELKKQNIAVSLIGEKYFESVSYFKQKLVANNQLNTLVYIGRENKGEELFDKRLGIYATETFITMKSGNDTIRCKLGEMFKIDGKWKSFTSPKLGW